MLYLDTLYWDSLNAQRVLSYDTAQPRGSQLVLGPAEPINPDESTVPNPAGPPSRRTYTGGDVIRPQFCEDTDGVTITALTASPYASVAVESNAVICSNGGGQTCDLQGTVTINPDSSVSVAATTSHPPFVTSLDDITYEDTTTWIVPGATPGSTHTMYFRDAIGCKFTQPFSYPTSGGPTDPPPPAGYQQIASFCTSISGQRKRLYFNPTTTAILVDLSQDDTCTVSSEPVIGAVLYSQCVGTTLREVFYTGTGSTGAQFQQTANSPACGYEPPTVIRGCTDPDASNYNPDATEDDGSCEYLPPPILLSVAQLPSDWAPVHLPVLLTLTAQPDVNGEPRDVLCFIDASNDNGVSWSPCGRIRRTAGDNKLVQFNLSEYLKSRFSIVAPIPGLQPSLSLRWRVRLGFAPLFTGGTDNEELRLDTLHVVNGAAVNQGLGTYLSDLLPLPVGYDYLLSKITTTGIQNLTTLAGVEEAPCPPYPLRLVWLNQKGGWNSHVFGGKHEYSTSSEGGTVYEDEQQAQRYADRGAVRPSVQVYSDRLLPEAAGVIGRIRENIQVYHLPESGEPIAVRVEEGTYRNFQAGDKTRTVDFTIIYPRVPVQTQ